jgi:hypothetical protein
VSDETGRNEVFICPFPDTERGKWQVSDGGAGNPLWAHSGRELFYVATNGDMTVAEIHTGPPFSVGQRQALFQVPAISYEFSFMVGSYDIAADDQRFLMRRLAVDTDEDVSDTPRLILVQNWFAELEEKLGQGND